MYVYALKVTTNSDSKLLIDSRFFLTIDIFSLFIQGGGGGMAAQGATDPNKARLVSSQVLTICVALRLIKLLSTYREAISS